MGSRDIIRPPGEVYRERVAEVHTGQPAHDRYQQTRRQRHHRGQLLCIEFLTLTATRSGEARGATWDEVDEYAATWTIPGARMKTGHEHRVPLSTQAMAVLKRAREYRDGSGLLFPSATGKVLSDNTLSKLFRENEIAGTPHGMRSSFRVWAAECSDAPREIAEMALAHIEGSAAELAYRRTDYFERRRELMQSWATAIA